MKVVYRSIVKEIERAVEAAEMVNRTIEYIELAPWEYSELIREAEPHLSRAVDVAPGEPYGVLQTTVCGVEIRRQQQEPAR